MASLGLHYSHFIAGGGRGGAERDGWMDGLVVVAPDQIHGSGMGGQGMSCRPCVSLILQLISNLKHY